MVFAVVERPFFAEVVAAFKHFAVGVVTVVFVAGYQSVGLAVFDHDVVAVGETAQFFAVASVNGGQIAVAVVVVAHQFLAVEGDGGEAVRRHRGRRFGRGRLKNRNRVRACRTHPTSGLKVLCRLRLAAQTSLVFSKSAGVKTIFPATCFFNKSTSLVNLF